MSILKTPRCVLVMVVVMRVSEEDKWEVGFGLMRRFLVDDRLYDGIVHFPCRVVWFF